MKRILLPALFLALLWSPTEVLAQSAQVQFNVTQNDQSAGGTLQIQVENKVTGISPSTLGSATLDILFDNTHLNYVSSANGAFSFLQGYSISVTDNTDSLRLSILGTAVSPGNGLGHDIPTVYNSDANMRVINFSITAACIAAGTTDITFGRVTPTVGYFENQSNNPDTGVINDFVPDTFGDAIGVVCDPGLPVELNEFGATVDGQSVNFVWQTISEVGTTGFAIEVNTNDTWAELGYVEAAGSASTYQFTAAGVDPGQQSFRLKVVDTDGSVSYSEIIELTVEVPGAFAISDAYPNPFNPFASFNVAVKESQHVQVGIFNSLGQQVQALHNGRMIANETYEFQIDGTGLSSGMYLIKVTGGKFSTARTVTLLK